MPCYLPQPAGPSDSVVPGSESIVICFVRFCPFSSDSATIHHASTRYSDCEDGVAVFLALKQVVYRDQSGLHLSRINREIANFALARNGDPAPQLNEFVNLQTKLAKLTTYDWNNQQSALKDLLTERHYRLAERDYECAAHFVNVVSNHWCNYVRPEIAAAVQRNKLKHAATVAGIDGRNNGDSERGGGGKGNGGNGNGKKQHERQQQGKNTRDGNGNIRTCFLCRRSFQY